MISLLSMPKDLNNVNQKTIFIISPSVANPHIINSSSILMPLIISHANQSILLKFQTFCSKISHLTRITSIAKNSSLLQILNIKTFSSRHSILNVHFLEFPLILSDISPSPWKENKNCQRSQYYFLIYKETEKIPVSKNQFKTTYK